MNFFRIGKYLVAESSIKFVDISGIESLKVIIHHEKGFDEVQGPDAIELVMSLKPSALEGKKLRWIRHAWAVHNLIGHPAMQLFTWFGMKRLGLKIHDETVPRPKKSY